MYKILFLSYYFPPTGGGGVQRVAGFLKYLPASQYDVHLITAEKCGLNIEDTTLLNTQNLDFSIHRVGRAPGMPRVGDSHRFETPYWKRIMSSLLFFPDSRSHWQSAVLNYLKKKPEILDGTQLIIATVPPFTAALTAKKISQFNGIPYVLDYRDGWIFNPFQLFPLPYLKNRHMRMEESVLKKTAGLIFVNESLQQKYLETYKRFIQDKPIVVIHNGFFSLPDSIPSRNTESTERLLHIGLPGTIYFRGNRPRELLNFLKTVQPSNLCFHLVGKFTKNFYRTLSHRKLYNYFHYHPYLNHNQYLQLLNEFDCNVIFIEKKIPHTNVWIPGRFFELLAHPTPLIVMGPADHEIQQIISRVGGQNYFVTEIPQLLQKLNDIVNGKPSESVDQEYLNQFKRKNLAKKFWQFISKVMGQPKGEAIPSSSD